MEVRVRDEEGLWGWKIIICKRCIQIGIFPNPKFHDGDVFLDLEFGVYVFIFGIFFFL
jgi:hypothetical protein